MSTESEYHTYAMAHAKAQQFVTNAYSVCLCVRASENNHDKNQHNVIIAFCANNFHFFFTSLVFQMRYDVGGCGLLFIS